MNEQMIAWANSTSEFVDRRRAASDAALRHGLCELAKSLNTRYYELCHEYAVAEDAEAPGRVRIAGEMEGLAEALRGISDLWLSAQTAMIPERPSGL